MVFLPEKTIYPSLDTMSLSDVSTLRHASSVTSSAASSTTVSAPTIRMGNRVPLNEMPLFRKLAEERSKHARRVQPPSVTSNDTSQFTSEESHSDYGGSYTTIQVPQGFDNEQFPMRTQQPNTFAGYDPDYPMGPFL
jgi:hypothetical protein